MEANSEFTNIVAQLMSKYVRDIDFIKTYQSNSKQTHNRISKNDDFDTIFSFLYN